MTKCSALELNKLLEANKYLCFLCEKKSVATALADFIAGIIGAEFTAQGHVLVGKGESGAQVSFVWSDGHLYEQVMPEEIDARWKSWDSKLLPILPKAIPWKPIASKRPRIDFIKQYLLSEKITDIVVATDAHREGELIARNILDSLCLNKSIYRMWLKSLSREGITNSWSKIMPLSQKESYYQAALTRSQIDWLMGINFSRAMSNKLGETFPIGRVQTAILAIIMRRGDVLANSKAKYCQMVVQANIPEQGYIKASLFWEAGEAITLKQLENQGVSEIAARKAFEKLYGIGAISPSVPCMGPLGLLELKDSRITQRRLHGPELFDLTGLQAAAFRLFGMSAEDTLQAAQELYEKFKLISYPRTDSCKLPLEMKEAVFEVYSCYLKLIPELEPVCKISQEKNHDASFFPCHVPEALFSDLDVNDHHAIIPERVDAEELATVIFSLSQNQLQVYLLVVSRFMAQWAGEQILKTCILLYAFRHKPQLCARIEKDYFESEVDKGFARPLEILQKIIPEFRKNVRSKYAPVGSPNIQKLNTLLAANLSSHPVYSNDLREFDQASLLVYLTEIIFDGKKYKIGTAATRTQIIKSLFEYGYIHELQGKLKLLPKAEYLLRQPFCPLTSEKTSCLLEMRLSDIEKSPIPDQEAEKTLKQAVLIVKDQLQDIKQGILLRSPRDRKSVAFMSKTTESKENRNKNLELPSAFKTDSKKINATTLKKCLLEKFGLTKFRSGQQIICQSISNGRSALVVMPTGSGKSLCYQLPGLMRGGCTLVLCPLIALMHDQVQALNAKGIPAAYLHYGMDRRKSQQVCSETKEGKIKFLYVAPERFTLPNFFDFLLKCPISLIAIDEAHCISNWGHDFRPEYRKIITRIGSFGKMPVVCLTATASRSVRTDILQLLSPYKPKEFIFGIRRKNIAAEISYATEEDKVEAIASLASTRERLPMIVYAGTRQKSESLPKLLEGKLPSSVTCQFFHAGIDPIRRKELLDQFIAGEIHVLVATTAFGMGIDIPNIRSIVHLNPPQSMEQYYQEIGRAGRDGKACRSLLLYNDKDIAQAFYLVSVNLPEPKIMQGYLEDFARGKVDLGDPVMANLARKFKWHESGEINQNWVEDQLRGYREIRKDKFSEFFTMLQFLRSKQCRMQQIVEYFGVGDDDDRLCGHCDNCFPEFTLAGSLKRVIKPELVNILMQKIGKSRSLSKGRAWTALKKHFSGQRSVFEKHLLYLEKNSMCRQVDRYRDIKSHAGKSYAIVYQELALTQTGKEWHSRQLPHNSSGLRDVDFRL